MPKARFKFDPNLLETLAQQYRSSEAAIVELVANCWDADATRVEITLPEPMSSDPIIIRDNGDGMSSFEIQTLYFTVGYDRRVERGENSRGGRTVRGSRGIGKFAGLQAAKEMKVIAVRDGTESRLSLDRTYMSQQDSLETQEIDISERPVDLPNGTTIELSKLRHDLEFPVAERLKPLLLRQFGLRPEFQLVIDGDLVSGDDLDAERQELDLTLADGTTISGTVWITKHPRLVPEPGVIIRVKDRAIGSPRTFGLEKDPEVPRSYLNRLVGEIRADHLEQDVLSNWDAFIENSIGLEQLASALAPELKRRILSYHHDEVGSQPEDFVQSFEEQIERVPVPRRELVRRALHRIFRQFFDEALERRRAIAELVINAFERDEYWLLVQAIDESELQTIADIADLLDQWGLYEIAGIAERARGRLALLNRFVDLLSDTSTPELSGMHRFLEANAWIVADRYELMKSNASLRRIMEDVLDTMYKGHRASDRPDLFLVGTRGQCLLVELKRPSRTINRDDVAQAERYRDEIILRLPQHTIDIRVIGGSVDVAIATGQYARDEATTYDELFQEARLRMEWLVENFDEELLHRFDGSQNLSEPTAS